MGLEKFNIQVSTWIRTQPVARPVRLSELMTRPLLSVPPVRRLKHPPLGAMAWLLITGTILSLCHISPAGAFSPFILSGFRSVWSRSNCMFHCKPRHSDKTSLQLSTLSIHTARPQSGSPLLQSCRPQPRVVLTLQTASTSPHLAHPYLHTTETTRELL